MTITLTSPSATSLRDHWPMHGPQALASTVAPASSKIPSSPSRAMVARICSEPGVTSSGACTFNPCATAPDTMLAARVMSS